MRRIWARVRSWGRRATKLPAMRPAAPSPSRAEIRQALAEGTREGLQNFDANLSAKLGRDYAVEAPRIQANVERIKYLKRVGAYPDAVGFLKAEVDLQEADAARNPRWGVAPWAYEQLAIIYRKLDRPADERAILERFAKQPHAPGAGAVNLLARLEQLRGKSEPRAAKPGNGG